MLAASVDSSLQLSISAETPYIQQAILSFYQSKKNMNPCPYPSPKHGKMPIMVTALVFYLCALYYRSLCTL